MSFNHDKGEWEAVGTMTVSADGKLICSDPGSGIRQPGWSGTCPPPKKPPPPKAPPLEPSPCTKYPDPDDLTNCYHSADLLEETCRTAAGITFLYGMRRCVAELAVDEFNPEGDFQLCVGLNLEKYKADLKACRGASNKEHDMCNCAYGVGGPPQSFSSSGSSNSEGLRRVALAASAPSVEMLIDAKIAELAALISTNPPPSAAVLIGQVKSLLNEIDALANGDITSFLVNEMITAERAFAKLPVIPFLEDGNAPAYPVKFVAEITRPSGLFEIRGETKPFGQYAIFVPADGLLTSVTFYDPQTRRIARIQPDYRPEASYGLPRFWLHSLALDEPDTDGDGLPDIVEFVYGTNPSNPDSDGDGITDGAEVNGGTNPLDGQPAASGVISANDTPGTAVDICAWNDLAAVADSTAGVTLFDVSDPTSPVRLAQYDTPGKAVSVAGAGTLLAIADDTGGVALLDVSKPSAPSLIAQVPLDKAARAPRSQEHLQPLPEHRFQPESASMSFTKPPRSNCAWRRSSVNGSSIAPRSKSRRRRQETLTFFCFSEEMNESRDLDSYKIGFLNGLLEES